MGIINTKTTTSSNQLGPSDRRSGNARYTPPAATIATNAGQRGSRIILPVMVLARDAPVEFSTVRAAAQKAQEAYAQRAWGRSAARTSGCGLECDTAASQSTRANLRARRQRCECAWF